MYLYYQDLGDVTEFCLSSDKRTNKLIWNLKSEKTTAEFIIWNLKQVPVQNRLMDDKTKIWSIIGASGPIILQHFKSFITQGALKCTLIQIEDDLQARLAANRLDKPLTSSKPEEIKFKEEDFFYQGTAQNSTLNRDEVIQRLEALLNMPLVENNIIPLPISMKTDEELKRMYRKAALKYHPDRNNGDGSKMSELNMLWNIFNQGVSK